MIRLMYRYIPLVHCRLNGLECIRHHRSGIDQVGRSMVSSPFHPIHQDSHDHRHNANFFFVLNKNLIFKV